MKVVKSTVEKLTITEALIEETAGWFLDPVAVIVENFGPGSGKITITCAGEAWSHYWSHMGEGVKLAEFVAGCDDDYLIRKLSPDTKRDIEDDDPEKLEALLKREIIKDRRMNDITREQARERYNSATSFDRHHNGTDLLYEVLGDEWWYLLPKKSNPKYEHLRDIIRAVKQALTEEEPK